MNSALSSISSLFHQAWERYRAVFRGTFQLSLALGVVSQLFSIAPPSLFKQHPFFAFVYSLVALAILLWIGSRLSVALYYAIEDEAKSEWQVYYDRAADTWRRYLGTKLLQGVLVLVGLVLLVVPGLILAIQFAVADWVAVFEGLPASESLKRSRAYVKGRWWGVLGRIIVLGVSIIPLYLIVGLLNGGVSDAGPTVVGIIANVIVVTLVTPWSVAFMNALYKDLRRTQPIAVSTATEPVSSVTPAANA